MFLIFDHADLGIDLAYERLFVPGGPVVRSTTHESTLYWIPRLTPVFVASDGTIALARKNSEGDHTIVVNHNNDWLTVYSGLEHMFVSPSDRMPRYDPPLETGHMLGYVGRSKSGAFKPLHFELWRRNRRHTYDQVDPLRFMRRWRQIEWSNARLEREHGPPRVG